MKKDALIIVRGGGDLATGTIYRLWSAGLRVLVLETTQPAAIRRQVALCEAVYEGEATVEGLRAVRIEALEQSVDRFGRIASSVERLATNMEGMLKEQERQGERLDKLEGKPGENWNVTVKSILAAIGSAIGGGLVVAIATMLIK